MFPTPSAAQQAQLLSHIGLNSNSSDIRVAKRSGVIANIVDSLQNSWLSQLLISWFGDSGTKAVANFVDQVRDGHGADVSKPISFVTGKGDLIQAWDSGNKGKSELSYTTNGGAVTTVEGGSVALLSIELSQAAHRVLNEQEVSGEDLENLKKTNMDGFNFTARLGDDFTDCDLTGTHVSLSIPDSPWFSFTWNNYLGSTPDQKGTLLSMIASVNDPMNRVKLVNQLLKKLGHDSINFLRTNIQHKVLPAYHSGSLTVFEDVLIPFLFSDPVYLQDKDIKLYLRAYYISPKIAAANKSGLLVADVEEVKLILEKYEALTPWMGTLKGEMKDNKIFFEQFFNLCKEPGYEVVNERAAVLEKIFEEEVKIDLLIKAANKGELIANVTQVKLILERYEDYIPYMGSLSGEMCSNENFFKQFFNLCKEPGYEVVKERATVLEQIFDEVMEKQLKLTNWLADSP